MVNLQLTFYYWILSPFVFAFCRKRHSMESSDSTEDFFKAMDGSFEASDVHELSDVLQREALRLLGASQDLRRRLERHVSSPKKKVAAPTCTATSANVHLGEAAHVPEKTRQEVDSGVKANEMEGQLDLTPSQFDELFNGEDPFVEPVEQAQEHEPVVAQPQHQRKPTVNKRKRKSKQQWINEQQPTKWPRHLLAAFPHIPDPPGAKKNSHTFEPNPDFDRYWHNATRGYGGRRTLIIPNDMFFTNLLHFRQHPERVAGDR